MFSTQIIKFCSSFVVLLVNLASMCGCKLQLCYIIFCPDAIAIAIAIATFFL